MATSPPEGPEGHNVIVKADEVDQLGANITSISDEQLMAEMVDTLPLDTTSDLRKSAHNDSNQRRGRPGGRPELRANAAVPPPPMQPPPPAPGQQGSELSSDSLSLAQLKKIVQGIPGTEQRPYAFSYADCQSFPEELDEWFQYSEPERMMLLASKMSFDQRWQELCEERSLSPDTTWIEAGDESRKAFVTRMLESLQDPDMFSRIEALETICYTMAGVWGLTGGKVAEDYPEEPTPAEAAETPRSKSLQIKWIVSNVILVHECGGLKALFDYMRSVYDKDREPLNDENSSNEQEQAALIIAREREANLILTCMYFMVEVARREERTDITLRDAITALQPSLPVTLVEIIARLRWDDTVNVPFTRVILLFWKSILLIFGGSDALKHAKSVLEPPLDIPDDPSGRRKPFLTASPLDYHIFRQEIISKYPAYNPPPSVVPLEPEHNSILPPLPSQTSRPGAGGGASMTGGSGSILNQSVHIATPAPSPPPSPVGPGGKLGKKQNYQTNQHFPFMYPPMDEPIDKPGKEGTSDRQDKQGGKKWEGSGVPASIVEAGKLFASRVKMTRATRQLWEERDRFMKFERGWNADEIDEKSQDQDNSDAKSTERPAKKETDDEDVQRRLDAVEAFYRRAMPHLQSLVIVLLKVILTNVSAMVNQQNNSQSNGTSFDDPTSNIDELDMIRLREITSKAVSGSLLLLLKWFKRSHILKFEYMTQLLLDSNYLPLILKMFAHQDVDTMVSQKNDRKEYSFFHFCVVNSDNPPDEPLSAGEESPNSEDEAVPPPIPRRRASMTGTSSVRGPSPEKRPALSGNFARAEGDDLVFAADGLPREPITTYSFRNFFSAINYLHIMQKITRDKAHRCLLLVQYKSSTILRKLLKIPDPHLQLYTLKLFKSQVPYCGRKWRQSNMRVITAIYLYCRPELRDDWLAGSDVDAEIEEALPLEQALRGLTHWWHLRQYKDIKNIEEGANLVDEERDFFTRELEAMGWELYSDDMHNDVDDRDQGPPMEGTEWDGEPMQSEGW